MNRTHLSLAAALLLAACGGGKPAAAPAKGAGPSTPVVTAAVRQQAVPLTLESIGNVEAMASVAVKSLVDGQITEVKVKDGQDVTRGQPLFQIDPRPFQVQLATAQANLTRDQALLSTARAQEQRYRDLLAQGFVSKNDYATVQNNLDTAAASVTADQNAIETAKLQLDYADIRAPIGGRLGKIALQAGNLVKANDANPLVTLNQLDPIYVSFTVPETQFSALHAAMQGRQLAVAARDQQSSQTYTGQLTFIDNAVDTTTGTLRLRATFDNARGQLWPGQFVDVTLTLSSDEVLTIAPEALQTGPKGQYVWVIDADHKAQLRDIVVARTTPDVAVIARGLKAGEKVVIDGQSRLTPGALTAER
ncbi:MAG TPA: efflux RND transporter periplasmic adaptor subunit, partial [Nevskiaceae bacterium]|nr:efflux RND transporter periplasmic adaptor subunit [Nevskiaceae bacterium]